MKIDKKKSGDEIMCDLYLLRHFGFGIEHQKCCLENSQLTESLRDVSAVIKGKLNYLLFEPI